MASKHAERNYGEMNLTEIIETVIDDALMGRTFTYRKDRNDGATYACTVRSLMDKKDEQ